ncbi:MAG: PQQ-dependent sugar dehydrogenase [Anaerolineae bacterium]|nr:PQQ-dependent sugar dehydrogenase [Anaerolineae bacterium]
MRRLLILTTLITALLAPAPLHAESAPLRLILVANGFLYPLAVAFPPNLPATLFVTTLNGYVWVVQDGNILPTPFLNIKKQITMGVFGQGLLGMVLDPAYAENGLLYVTYVTPDSTVVLERYQASAANPLTADPASRVRLMTIPHPTDFHYGGQLAFSPDGYLYWSMGDGAQSKLIHSPAQDVSAYLGSIFRLDVRGQQTYRIPPDNPYVNTPNAKPEIWAKGLRNPWRFSFDRATGDMYIADVGEAAIEELNVLDAPVKGGANFGWNRYEGDRPYLGGDRAGLTFPVLTYTHDQGDCNIVGGYVYRGHALTDLIGAYLFADYCTGRIWSTRRPTTTDGTWQRTLLLDTDLTIVTFAEDPDGELYLAEGKGGVYRLEAGSQ